MSEYAKVAAIAGAALFVPLMGFQGLLAAGAPLGRYAWGGQFTILPKSLRVASAITIVLYSQFAYILLARSQIVDSSFNPPCLERPSLLLYSLDWGL
jgi:hypothetical protein